MRLFVAIMALLVASPVAAQTTALDAAFPAPAIGEFGPHEPAPDGLALPDITYKLGGAPHVDGEGFPDQVGAFRFICRPGHVAADDPVVFPGKPGFSHGHQFYGNLSTNGNSTYESQRAAGVSSCGSQANRSGYWMPAMISGGKVLRPYEVVIYYKREPKSSKWCNPNAPEFIGICVGIPNAMRFIFGADMISGTVPTGYIDFYCYMKDGGSLQHRPGTESGQDMVKAVKGCQAGDVLGLQINSPTCWDGKNLDSANHRSHTHNVDEATGKCPLSHPYYMPHFLLNAHFVIDGNLNTTGEWEVGQKTWYLSSDIMYGMTPRRPGSTFHADYFEGWNPRVKKAWTDNCIDRFLNCSTNDLGNGYGVDGGRWVDTLTQYVPLPASIRGPFHGNTLHAGH